MGRGNSLTTRVAQSGFSLQRDCAETELLNLVLASDFELRISSFRSALGR
jgi:hypothetical protein